MRQVCGPAGCWKGKQRSVACVSSFTSFSSSSLPAQPPRAHLPAHTQQQQCQKQGPVGEGGRAGAGARWCGQGGHSQEGFLDL